MLQTLARPKVLHSTSTPSRIKASTAGMADHYPKTGTSGYIKERCSNGAAPSDPTVTQKNNYPYKNQCWATVDGDVQVPEYSLHRSAYNRQLNWPIGLIDTS
jgi:hypothetical protein